MSTKHAQAYLVEASSQEQPWQAPEPFWDWPDAREGEQGRRNGKCGHRRRIVRLARLGATVQESDIVETIDTEFLIVGAGTGGLFAACAAGEEGIETFVLEKYNGSVVRDDVGGVNSRLQQESGYTMDLQEYLLDMNHYAAANATSTFIRRGTKNRAKPSTGTRPCSTSTA